MATDQEEAQLRLADYAAGLTHSAHIENPGRIPMPIAHDRAKALLQRLDNSGRLVVQAKPFDVEYAEVFGSAYAAASNSKAS